MARGSVGLPSLPAATPGVSVKVRSEQLPDLWAGLWKIWSHPNSKERFSAFKPWQLVWDIEFSHFLWWALKSPIKTKETFLYIFFGVCVWLPYWPKGSQKYIQQHQNCDKLKTNKKYYVCHILWLYELHSTHIQRLPNEKQNNHS